MLLAGLHVQVGRVSLKPPVSCLALTETHPAHSTPFNPHIHSFTCHLIKKKMATRRIIATEKTILDKDDHIEEKSNIAPAVPK